MTDKSLTLPSHIAKFVSGLELTPVDELAKMNPIQRVGAASFGLKLELAGKLYAGFALMGLKEEMGHGKYLAALAEQAIPPRSASYCTNIVKLAIRIPASNWQTFANLEPSKLDLMTSWTDAELKAFCKGEEIRGITVDDARELSVRDMKAQLKEAQASTNELEQELEKEKTARMKAEDKNRMLLRKQMEPEGFSYPATVERVRIEGSVLSSQANLCLDDIEQFMTELMQATDLSTNKEKQQAEFSAGATTLYLNLKSVHNKAAYLLNWFAETIGEDYMPDKPEDIPRMTEQEAMRIHDMRSVMLDEHRIDKIVREDARKSNRKNRGAKGKKA